MKIRDLKIGTQIRLALASMLCFVLFLGALAFYQTNKIHEQIEILYNHPLQVKTALGELKADIIAIQRDMRDIFLVLDKNNTQNNTQEIDVLESHGFEQIGVLEDRYLGNKQDIKDLKENYIKWNSIRHNAIQLLHEGNFDEAKIHLIQNGDIRIQAIQLLDIVNKINSFATKKSQTLYSNSVILNQKLIIQIIVIVLIIIALSFIINITLYRNIKRPVSEFIETSHRFHAGNLLARNTYTSANEFGTLSQSFNAMVENIQHNVELNEMAATISNVMLLENEARGFFKLTLSALTHHTDSQMAAVYLLSNDKKRYDHFTSIGLNENARHSFNADELEGEFGVVLSTRSIQHVTIDGNSSRFVFNTVSGDVAPCEMIAIPILSLNEVIGIISLASIKPYSKRSQQLIDKIMVTLSTRIVGVLTFDRIKNILQQLETQNAELEIQKQELSSQSAEMMQQNAELEMQKTQLTEASLLKTNFLSNMSHELRTPLNSVIALSGVLNRKLTNQIPQEEYSYLKVIERNGKHLLELINDILDISRIEAGKEEIDITTFKIDELVADVTTMIHPQAKQKNIDLLYTTDNASLFMTSDAKKCRHILQNIIGNAVKFTEQGNVTVSVIHTHKKVEIQVKDTGIGIDEIHVPHIFDEFRQADGSTSRKFGGSGLGLAIAQKFAHLLGGTISVQSNLGEGSQFTISLPLLYAAENRVLETVPLEPITRTVSKIPTVKKSRSHSKTILLVEDSEPAIIQIKDFLEDSGYRILVANNALDAYSIIEKTLPDAMILDLMMPDIDGFTVLKTIRSTEATAQIPVLILTAKHITNDDLQQLTTGHIHQLIQKGDVNRTELLQAVQSMVTEPEELGISASKPIQSIKGKPTILVVEDNADNMITVKALLADTYTVVEAVDGREGIELAVEFKPNLILMDIALPGIDGIQAFNEIRKYKHLQHIPIIALTASALTSDRETILAHGFDGYLVKPIDDALFFKTINETLYGK